MNELLHPLRRQARLSNAELAAQVSSSEEAVAAQIAAWEADGTIRGYQAMIDPAQDGVDGVTAFIEVKLTPERGGGFDRLARRIARFEQVTSCYLASGGYDLLVVVEDRDLITVAAFVAVLRKTAEAVKGKPELKKSNSDPGSEEASPEVSSSRRESKDTSTTIVDVEFG